MPRIIESIGEIATRLSRQVLMVSFGGKPAHASVFSKDEYSWKDDVDRCDVLNSLKRNGIKFHDCFPILDSGWLLYSYEGHVFVDVPNDLSNKSYIKLVSLLETEDGKPRDPNIVIWIVPPR